MPIRATNSLLTLTSNGNLALSCGFNLRTTTQTPAVSRVARSAANASVPAAITFVTSGASALSLSSSSASTSSSSVAFGLRRHYMVLTSPPSPRVSPSAATLTAAHGQIRQSSMASPSPVSFRPAEAPSTARDFLKYVDSATDPFHAVESSRILLEAAGFKKLKESEQWDHHLHRGGRYYYTRNGSALVAFAVGEKYEPGQGGVHAVGAHTDSPCFKLKPVSKKEKAGYLQVGVETYGGGLWNTWWDRDLGLSGRVIVADDASPDCASFKTRLVSVRDRPILRIPNLAIHLNRGASDNYKFNVEEHMVPILGLVQKNVADQLNGPASTTTTDAAAAAAATRNTSAVGTPTMQSKHAPLLLAMLAQELKVDPIQIHDFELSLFDVQPASIGGANNEFIHSARLDNLMSCFCSVTALLASVAPGQSTLADSTSIRAICLFDNEEVGSVSNQGADSSMLPSLIRRLARISIEGVRGFSGAGDGFDAAVAKSFLISADMAHAVHPNYMGSYEAQNSAELGKGVVIKTNYKQRYASTSATTFMVRRWARLARSVEATGGGASAGIPLQEFSVRNDMPCGSTIGPMLSKNGIRTVDLGIPQLAMHSIREVCSSRDPDYLINLFESFWAHGEQVLDSLEVD
ncbi:unnamed protein product [Parajaminaea phylloscopi]